MKVERDTFKREVNLANFSRSGAGEHSVKIGEMSCPVNITGEKKIMEKQSKLDEDQRKDEHRTSNIERPMVNEKDKNEPEPEPEAQVCKDPECEFGGQAQPIGNFQIHGRSKGSGVRIGTCKSCMTRKRLAGTKRKTSNKKPAAAPGDTPQPETETPPAPRDLKTYQYYPHDMLETLLDGLPEVLKTIKETAHEQERTPVAQVRYLLKTDCRITGDSPEVKISGDIKDGTFTT